MTLVFDPDALPSPIRGLVETALREREGHERAIEAIEAHLEAGGERTPDLLIALATVTYDDAAAVVLHRLEEASREALRLLDEAAIARGSMHGLEPLRSSFESARVREEERSRRMRVFMVAPERARPAELAELALRQRLQGDDALAQALLDEAGRLDATEEEDAGPCHQVA
ncbi:MAG: hypothetical protein AB8I08_27240 [Sandaracinaceae bacterium]